MDDPTATEFDAVDTCPVLEATLLEPHPVSRLPRLEVTLIRPVLSANRLRYPRHVLERSIPLWEGAAAFIDHPTAVDLTRAGTRSLRDLAGVYSGVRFREPTGDDPGGLRATLTFYPTAAWAHELAAAAIADRAAGRAAADIGISADMRLLRRPNPDGTFEVDRITRVVSADLVFRPSAGGTFDRVVEAAAPAQPEERSRTVPEPAIAAAPPESPPPAPPVSPARPATPPAASPRDGLEAALGRVEAARLAACRHLLGLTLAASDLPPPARALVRAEFEGQVFEAEALDARVAALRAMLGEVFAPAAVRGAGAERPHLAVGLSPLDRVQAALDRLFDLPLPDALSAVPRLSGVREAYLALTGDSAFTGRPDPEAAVVREAGEVTGSVLANALANSMTKRIVADYAAQPKWWAPLVVKTPISDFKQQQRIHLNDFASLSTVAENAAYTNLTWGDARETYTPAKRGNLVVVTLEAIVNDDTHAITRIPRKLAAAGAATLNEFVAGLFTANGGFGSTLSDSFNVMDAANHQGNAAAVALSTAALQSALIALLKMQNSAGKRLGLVGRYLLTPPDLHFAARTILESVNLPGSANNDVNPVRGALEPISVPNWVDANNWYVLVDRSQMETIELGFLNGREEPELIVQDGPRSGSVFTNDAISWKVRHVFGGGWLDYRGVYGSVVAG